MAHPPLGPEDRTALEQVLGYLNFSSGAPDARFLAGLNRLFESVGNASVPPDTSGDDKNVPAPLALWRQVTHLIRERIPQLREESAAFRDTSQSEAVLDQVEKSLIPGYFDFHRDLLFHQSDAELVGSFLLGRFCEAILQQGGPFGDADRIRDRAIRGLNDYLGYRPVPALETQRLEPYPHEFCRPVPIYVEGAGCAYGKYREVLALALDILRNIDDDLLQAAYFDPNLVAELAYDPRAYDFDHPANRRPNYHFGQWDPHQIDNQGFYRRFVLQQVTLDSLWQRVEEPGKLPRDEVLWEAAAVLAGTVLMAAGISGSGPESHDSSVSLGTLLPHIAAYRDEFYVRLLQNHVHGAHAARLAKEAEQLQQPFAAARQHLNAELARRRAAQLDHVHMAMLYARMGFSDAAARHADVVPAASARMQCRIHCGLTEANRAVDNGELSHASMLLSVLMDELKRGIQCGAIIDPWSILGFDAQYSLFPALENSIHDHRADELIAMMERIFDVGARVWSAAAAGDNEKLCLATKADLRSIAQWWHQFATHEVSSVESFSGEQTVGAAQHVAKALGLWHRGGASAGDVGFWAGHAEMFDSPEAYALVIEALLERGDFVASMALLIHWLEQGETVGLVRRETTFHDWAGRWMTGLWKQATEAGTTAEAWMLAKKFLDYTESNAGDFWHVPDFHVATDAPRRTPDQREDEFEFPIEPDEDDDLFLAAYEDMVYRDSTDDGVEGAIFESGFSNEDGLQRESKRQHDRLSFLAGLAKMWSVAAAHGAAHQIEADSRQPTIERWLRHCQTSRRDLANLMRRIHRHRISPPSGDQESMIEYDRNRLIKELLIENVVTTGVEMANSARVMTAALPEDALARGDQASLSNDTPEDERWAAIVCRAVLRGRRRDVRVAWEDFRQSLFGQPLLYIPLVKGGDPEQMLSVRVRQRAIRDLLCWLPRIGLFAEADELLSIAKEMETEQPVGPGAVTEFDDLFDAGFRAMVSAIIRWAKTWRAKDKEATETELVRVLEQLTQALLLVWLGHSRTLRLSVMERVKDSRRWREVVDFIQKYGGDLFTQQFLNLGSLRAILHHGVSAWIDQLETLPYAAAPRFVEQIDRDVPRNKVIEILTFILEAVIENYAEYRDYNSTTTQSDRGDMLHTLLDFLRLQADYERVAWNLQPVITTHEVLVRSGELNAARRWRRALSDRMREESERYRRKLRRLQKKHAMEMPSVADRVNEKFVRPMEVDRTRALIEPAIAEAGEGDDSPHFTALETATEGLRKVSHSAGFDLPPWLAALEDEIDRIQCKSGAVDDPQLLDDVIPEKPLSLKQLNELLDQWED
jgi:hypothetical protein